MNDRPFKNFFKIEKSYWLLVLPILHTTVPWVNYRLRGMIPAVVAMFWLLPKVSKIMTKFNCREGRAFLAAFFWFFILVFLREIFAIIGSQEHMQYHHIATIGMQLCYFLVAFYTIAYRKFNELRFLTILTLGGFILSGIGAVRGMGVEGLESARSIVSLQKVGHSISQDAIDNAINIVNLGLGGYGYIYQCSWVFCIMLFAFALTKNIQLRSLYLVTACCVAVSMKMGGLGTPVGIAVIGFIVFLLWFFIRNKKVVSICGYSLIGLFFIYATMPQVFSFLATPLESLASAMSGGSLKERIISMASAFRGEDSYATDRAQLQLISFRTFFKHPFLGTFGPFAGGSQLDLGGHSYILDLLGGYGLLGLFVFIMFIWSVLRYFHVVGMRYFGQKWLVLPVFLIVVFIFSGVLNPVTFPSNFIILVTGIAWMSLSTQEKNELWWRYNQMNYNWNR